MATPSQPEIECSVCGGTGWKTKEFPGKASRAVRCECRINTRVERLFKSANIPPRYQHCTLSNFDGSFEGVHLSLSRAVTIARRYVEKYPEIQTGLLFDGPFGVGKTHLAVGVLSGIIEKGFKGLFCDYRELLKEIQNSYNPSVQVTELQILKPVFDAEVLLLDELGAAKPSEWVWDAVQHILNTRYNSRQTTIFTTNFPFAKEITQEAHEAVDSYQKRRAGQKYTLGDRIGNRMISRLQEMCRHVKVDGSDYRAGPKNATTLAKQS